MVNKYVKIAGHIHGAISFIMLLCRREDHHLVLLLFYYKQNTGLFCMFNNCIKHSYGCSTNFWSNATRPQIKKGLTSPVRWNSVRFEWHPGFK
jgi:hypothetical protein